MSKETKGGKGLVDYRQLGFEGEEWGVDKVRAKPPIVSPISYGQGSSKEEVDFRGKDGLGSSLRSPLERQNSVEIVVPHPIVRLYEQYRGIDITGDKVDLRNIIEFLRILPVRTEVFDSKGRFLGNVVKKSGGGYYVELIQIYEDEYGAEIQPLSPIILSSGSRNSKIESGISVFVHPTRLQMLSEKTLLSLLENIKSLRREKRLR